MKKLLAILACLLACACLLCACGETTVETTTAEGTPAAETTAATETTTAPAETTVPETTTAAPVCEHNYEMTVTTPAGIKTDGTATYTCSLCGDSYTEVIPATNEISILAIGNSFSEDARQYLWDLCNAAGIEEITIGALYIGGCSLDTHWNNMQQNAGAYEYYENLLGTWSKKNNFSVKSALKRYDWDIITIQQVSQNSGMPSTFDNLQNILDYVNENKTNDDAKIYWHMTWAYESTSTHSGFVNYDKSQAKMYQSIVDTVKGTVLTNENIAGVIPSGTAIQNLRTSYLGDTLTRDGYHMSYDVGRYTAALTWFKALTGLDITDINWVPAAYPGVAQHLDAIKDAVNSAVANPFTVTASAFPKSVKTLTMTDADRAAIKAAGYDPENYYVLDWEPVVASYYNSGSNPNRVTSGASNVPNFTSSSVFQRADLPVGTIITVANGYQYRPEAWTSLSTKTNPRPENVTEASVVVTSAWWGNYNYRAFNLSAVQTKTMTAADNDKLRIYVPKTPVVVKEPEVEPVIKEEDIDLTKYTKIDWAPVVASYYNSSSNSSRVTSGANNVPNFTSSKMFTKAELPVGTIIVVDAGYQYRPEGWTALNTKTANRPGNVTTTVVVVDAAWWGNFNYRAFNLSATATKTMTEADSAHLRIYVPKS